MMRLSLIEMQECSANPSHRTRHSLPGRIRDRSAAVGTGALRRPRRRAQRQATERICKADTLGQPFRPLERGRGHRSAMSLPSGAVSGCAQPAVQPEISLAAAVEFG